ncbi:MAG: hypothetical protein K1X64_22300 [Myxococcaceae bacterium]|nr:hypothetical protein [Myxococcaceae bacterium]
MSAVVSRAEADALALARAVMGAAPFEAVQRLLLSARKAPWRMGPTAVGLLKDMLGKGAVLTLARGTGYQRDMSGRFWERHPPFRIGFGPSTVQLLQWLLEAPLGESSAQGVVLPEALGLGDELFLFQLLKLTQGSAVWHSVAQLEVARRSSLCALGFAFSLGQVRALDASHAFVWHEHSLLAVEAMQKTLERLWVASENDKKKVAFPSQLKTAGLSQEKALSDFLTAIDQADRRELANFLVRAAPRWLEAPADAAPGSWVVPALSSTAPLRERQEARRAAAAPYRALGRLAAWDTEHRGLRFIDDGYEKAQRLIAAYAAMGERPFARAAEVLNALDNTV